MPAPIDAKLVVTSGAKPAKLLLHLPTVIGRSGAAHLKVKHHQVSRKHCEIFEQQGQLKIRDLGSSNGTFINDQRIQGDFVLTPGDEITLGTVQLCVVFNPTAAAADSAFDDAPARSEDLDDFEPFANDPKTVADDKIDVRDRAPLEAVQLSGSAVLNYRDFEDGSFVGIDLDEPLRGALESSIDLDVESPALDDESQIRLEVDSNDAAPVADDSHLQDFLKGLGSD